MTERATPEDGNPDERPWMVNLTPQCREIVRAAVADAPPLSDRQRARLRMLFGQRQRR
jgi:hypothetical protein